MEQPEEESQLLPAVIKKPQLRPWQIEHSEKSLANLDIFGYTIDDSAPGAGKTHLTSFIQKKLDVPGVYFGPASSTEQTWLDAIKKYELETYKTPYISYNTLRGMGKHKLKHLLLEKSPEGFYIPTPELDELIDKNYLFVFDEIQNFKNASATLEAVKAITQRILRKKKGYFIFLSGSPLDDQGQVINLLNALGIMTSNTLYTNYFGRLDMTYFDNLISWVKKYNNIDEVNNWMAENPFIRKYWKNYLYRIFLRFIKPNISSFMPKIFAVEGQASLNIKNSIFKMNKRDTIKYEKIVLALDEKVQVDENGVLQRGVIQNIQADLQEAQMIKANHLVKIVKRDLEGTYTTVFGDEGKYKVMVYANYTRVIDFLRRELEEFNPLVITGGTAINERAGMIAQFCQQDNEFRLLIASTTVCAKSINPHDINGRFSRRHYIMPSYFVNDLSQAMMRTYRLGLIGEAYVRFVYGQRSENEEKRGEKRILEILSKSGQVMKEVLGDRGEIFLNDLEDEYIDLLDIDQEEELL